MPRYVSGFDRAFVQNPASVQLNAQEVLMMEFKSYHADILKQVAHSSRSAATAPIRQGTFRCADLGSKACNWRRMASSPAEVLARPSRWSRYLIHLTFTKIVSLLKLVTMYAARYSVSS